jgi:hypothetical protein
MDDIAAIEFLLIDWRGKNQRRVLRVDEGTVTPASVPKRRGTSHRSRTMIPASGASNSRDPDFDIAGSISEHRPSGGVIRFRSRAHRNVCRNSNCITG